MSKLIEFIINILDKYHQKKIQVFFINKNIHIVIDVGAHKGEFISYIKNIKPKIIYAFEPQKEIFKLLNKRFSKDKNIQLFNKALSDKNENKDFYINSLSSTSSLLKPNEKSYWMRFKKIILNSSHLITKKISLITYTLDSILLNKLPENKNILLKIDVEGNELNVIKGALKIIKTKRIIYIQVENARNNIYERNNQETVHKFLINNGYIKIKSYLYPTLSFSDDIYLKKFQ
jgi:FkbM family methyltransferase